MISVGRTFKNLNNFAQKFARTSFNKNLLNTSSVITRHNINVEAKQSKELSLRNEIVQRIKACGPITVAEYMNMVLTNPISVSCNSINANE